MATLTCPACTAAVQQDDLICFTCGANLPRDRPVNEPATPPTVMQEYLRRDGAAPAPHPAACPHCGSVLREPSSLFCLVCGQPLPQPPAGVISPVVLRLSFPTGNVEIPAGTSLVLGRDPEESLVAAAFADYDNVSRRHATVTVSDSGGATIRDERSTNGTFVNGDRVLPGTEAHLADGDRVRLGGDVTGQVSLPRQRDPNEFSQNGHRNPG
jgi:FHA domain/Double zinc ribbon